MNTAAHMTALAALYATPADDLRRQLPEVADALHAAMATLSRAPTPDAAELLAGRLEAAKALCLRLSLALQREGSHV